MLLDTKYHDINRRITVPPALVTLVVAIVSAVIAAMASLLKDLQPAGSQVKTRLLLWITLVGAAAAIVAAAMQFLATSDALESARDSKKQFVNLQGEVARQGFVVDSTGKITRGLNMPNDILPGNYSVRIAADSDPKRLFPYAKSLRETFPAIDRKYVCVVDMKKGEKTRYQLFFGRGINFTSAALFHALAVHSGYPPPKQPPALVTDDGLPCMSDDG